MNLMQINGYFANIQLELVKFQNHDAIKNVFDNKLSSKTQNSSAFSDFWKWIPKLNIQQQ